MNSDYVPGARREDVARVALTNSMDALSYDTAKDYLRNTKVSALFPGRSKIYKSSTDSTIGEALQSLIHHKILSMPVYDSKTRSFVAFIDLLDVVYQIVESLKGNQLTDSNFSQQISTSEKLSKTTVGYVAGVSGRNPFYPIDENAPLMAAIQLMADNHVQRIPVVSNADHEELATVISQSHVSQLILENIDKFEFKDKSVQSLGIGRMGVVTVDKRDKALAAFKQIHDNRISGVAVVDSTNGGILYANISASDIKHIGENANYITRLDKTVEEYLSYVCSGNTPTPISVEPTATFHQVLRTMVEKKLHRVYVIDQAHKPVGVISFTDILVAVVKHL